MVFIWSWFDWKIGYNFEQKRLVSNFNMLTYAMLKSSGYIFETVFFLSAQYLAP